MASGDKAKLDGLSNYTLPTATASTLGGVKIGSGISNSGGTISVPNVTTTANGLMTAADKTKLNGLGSNATTSANGLMSSADKTKLDGLNANNYVPRMTPQNFTIASNAWTKNSAETSEFVYYADIAVSGLTANDYVLVDLNRASQSIVADANLCLSGETLAGKIRVFSEKIPAATIGGQYTIIKGVA